jgi:uncharacterized protein (DUF924 family)
MFEWHHILEFWFGPLDTDGLPDRLHRQRWFQSDRAFDKEVRRRFLSLMLVASEGGLESWRKAPGGRLAEILLLDQIPRHVYRGTPLAYDYDRVARARCREGLDHAADVELPLIGRAFFYMPLQHSEKLADQDRAVALYEQLTALAPKGRPQDLLASFHRSAEEHREVIARFGRFPHRNKSQKRTSTKEELEYLNAGAPGFGQHPGNG